MLIADPARARAGGPIDGARSDDASGYAHRQLIGYIGLALPLVLIAVDAARLPGDAQWELHGSISSYYHTGAVAPFVGLLVALSLFLLTYRGYDNRYRWADRTAAGIGGVAALGVAFFPAGPPAGVPPPAWWTPETGALHYTFAAVLFAVFAVFSLWLFRLRSPGEALTADKQLRRQVHLYCGIIIIFATAWTGIRAAVQLSLFVPESLALGAFAVSWLVKGKADKTIGTVARMLPF